MQVTGAKTFWFTLDSAWKKDEKVTEIRAKYGKGVLLDVVDAFALMSKCDGLADMAKPAHREWAFDVFETRSVRTLYAKLDKLAEFGLIDPDLWGNFGHVTSNRALADAKSATETAEANRRRTEKAREKLAEKRRLESSENAVTESVTATVTDSAR